MAALLDTEAPVPLAGIGNCPLRHGSPDVMRTVGRPGVPVHAAAEDRFTPAALGDDAATP
ncbi:hypothetical protein ACFYW9_08025 [Streptomyces sp. NPDC002698]|uniref:hypothetical protein n=1 Tax=Streptomyces sp. NPDC002698 TaxID=3364660 RepID=UPI00367E0ED1